MAILGPNGLYYPVFDENGLDQDVINLFALSAPQPMTIQDLQIGQRITIVGSEPWVSDWRGVECEIAGLVRRNKGGAKSPLWVDEVWIKEVETGAVYDGFSVDDVLPA